MPGIPDLPAFAGFTVNLLNDKQEVVMIVGLGNIILLIEIVNAAHDNLRITE